MRELTIKEKILIKALVGKYHPQEYVCTGDILCDLYNIASIYPNITEESDPCHSFESGSVIIKYCKNAEKDFLLDFYEAILLICYLSEQRFLVLIDDDTPNIEYPVTHEHIIEMKFANKVKVYDLFPRNIWRLLKSTFIVSNALIDYSKDFKTVEQRNFSKTLKLTRFTIVISLAGLVLAIVIPQCTEIEIDNKQFDVLRKSINNSKTIMNDTTKIIPNTFQHE